MTDQEKAQQLADEIVLQALEVLSETMRISSVSSLCLMAHTVVRALAATDKAAAADYINVLAAAARFGKVDPAKEIKRKRAFDRMCDAVDAAVAKAGVAPSQGGRA